MANIILNEWKERNSCLELNSVWTVHERDMIRKDGTEARNTFKVSPEVEKGGRIKMDQIYNRLEELEADIRDIGANIGFAFSGYEHNSTPRADFDLHGLTYMLDQVGRHYEMFTQYLKFVNQRIDLTAQMQERGVDNYFDFQVRLAKMTEDKDAELNARHELSLALIEFCNEWERRMDDVRNILTPSAETNIDVAPYFLEQLNEIIRESRMVVFSVYILHQEATAGKLDANSN